MKSIDQMTDEEILEEMRKNGKKEGTPEYFMYSMLSTAHPNVIQALEMQAIQAKKAGSVLGKRLRDAENNSQEKSEVLASLSKMEQGFFAKNNDDDDEIPEM